MLFVVPSTKPVDEPLVIPVVAHVVQSAVRVATEGSIVICPAYVSVSAPSVQPAAVVSLKSKNLVAPVFAHVAVAPDVAAIVRFQPFGTAAPGLVA